MKKLVVLTLITSALLAQDYLLQEILVENEKLQDEVILIGEKQTLQTRSITLHDKLKRDVSFKIRTDSKGEEAISFRGLDFKATEYVEDGIPLYRRIDGQINTSLNMSSSTILLNDGSSTSSLGVSAMGGQVNIVTKIPQKEFESSLKTTISTNDEFYSLYVGGTEDDVYFSAETSYYHRSNFKLSDDFKPTPTQSNKTRVNSDKEQTNISLKAGTFINDKLEISTKISFSKSEYGIVPNTQTNPLSPVWNAYTRIDPKELASFYFYLDYETKYVDYSARAYYDEYKDIYEIYDSFYQTHDPLVTFDDSRLGSVLKAVLKSTNHKTSFIALAEQNEHLRTGGGFADAKTKLNTFKLSALDNYKIDDVFSLQTGISYNLLKEVESADASALSPKEDSDSFDAQAKLSYKNKKHSLYLGVAKKSRMPSIAEMFSIFPWENDIQDIDPEQSMQYTTGYIYAINSKSTLDLALYYYDIKDLIVFNGTTFENTDKAKHYGTELRFNTQELDNHSIDISYAYAKSEDDVGDELELIPNHKLRVQDSMSFNKALNAFVSYEYIGSRYSQNSATYTDEKYKVGAYNFVEAQLSYKFSKFVNTRVGIKNILDEDYEYIYGFPAEGRSYYFSIEIEL